MKIVHFFNLGNSAYRTVKLLRKLGVDAELIIDTTQIDPSNHPAWDELDIEMDNKIDSLRAIQNYPLPKWIKVVKAKKLMGRYSTYTIKLLSILKKYDVLHAHTTAQLWAPFSNVPYVSHCTGADLDELALKENLKGRIMLKSLRNSKLVFIGPQQIKLARKLGFKMKVNKFAFDFAEYKNINALDIRKKFNTNILLFAPSAHDQLRKGTLTMLKAFKKFARTYNDCKLLTVSWGTDLKESKNFVKKERLDKHVTFLPFVSHKRLLKYFTAADIVLDQFKVGGYGSLGAEALASNKPLLTYISDTYKSNYDERIPVMNVRTEDEIAAALQKLSDKQQRIKLQRKVYPWVKKHYNYKTVLQEYIKTYENLS